MFAFYARLLLCVHEFTLMFVVGLESTTWASRTSQRLLLPVTLSCRIHSRARNRNLVVCRKTVAKQHNTCPCDPLEPRWRIGSRSYRLRYVVRT
ncbi:MAG: hypothetical protein NXY57DRAFT_587768 [Lentinula lateritia]|uniref:Secreted protein n=1 Tax=Lentinula lateritia TaxID=40482 RepID=A0ABQ8VPN5_9AGAR|nr:MAG: hypothetical protein NXY57DRAFT_587768 [Lentinula lateritia]KAJ4497547.1 hypothetical protein C8R41DRAFT_210033 [Lentinula lateritia]